jgi:hypothetical protein
VTVELSAAEAEARLAAESAGRRVAAEPDVTIEDLEADLAAGRTEPVGDDDETSVEAAAEVADDDATATPPTTEDVADTAEPAVETPDAAPVVQLEERRSSTLRIIRRSKEDAPAEAAVELPVVEPAEKDEAVRVIREDVEAAPEPTPAPEPGPEAPAPADDVVAAVPDLAQEATSTRRNGVEALFARIRADRASAVAEARAVLDDEPPETATDVASGEPAAETRDEIEAGDERTVSDADEAALQRRDALLHRIDAALVRKLKRALQDDQNETLDRLRTRRGAATASDVLAAEADHAARFRDVAVGALDDAARAGAEFAGHADRIAGVGDQADEVALEIVVALRDRLTHNLEEGAAAGDDIGGVIDRVGTTYREWKLQRIEPLARHAVATVFARNAYAATPDGMRLRWVVDDDGGPCPDCDDDALAGPTEKGAAFPTGQLHPPAHPGCRCVLVAEVATG